MGSRQALYASALLLVATGALAANPRIMRCTAPNGSVTYQQDTCPDASDERATNIPSEYPESNRIERDRLLMREAALDERLLKRQEIDAAERIARDNRQAAQAQAQAERDQAMAQSAPFYVIGYLKRPVLHPFPHRTGNMSLR
jgi:hypothetical protein